MYEPDAGDIDVDGLQTTFVGTARGAGATILTSTRVDAISRSGHRWVVTGVDAESPDAPQRITAKIIVNAAGAWGDHVADLAAVPGLGLQPLVRSVFTFDPGRDASGWPMVVDAREQWYIKPEGPFMLGSAASEIPSEPLDARAPEIDVALGIERINAATTLSIRSVRNTWAGLRTFTPDRIPAVGFDDAHDGFFWLVGQGGYGIKTSPAIGRLAAGLIVDGRVPDDISAFGITEAELSPRRLR
jgi:D-arginine dehydrogenase